MIKNPWKENRLLHGLVAQHERTINMSNAIINVQAVNLKAMLDKADAVEDALRKIAAEEKPTSNATVKRMAKIARGALEL